MAKKKNRKVVRYRRPLNINVGMIIFALIFAYMAFYVYTYVRRDKIIGRIWFEYYPSIHFYR